MVKVALFIPCYIDQARPEVARATVRLLEGLGVECRFDPRQTCCGQPAYNCGYWGEARAVAEHFARVFEGCEMVVAPGGSCVSMVRNHYARLLGDAPSVAQRVRELCTFIVHDLKIDRVSATFPGRAAVHIPCHMLRELEGGAAVRKLLAGVDGLDCVDLPSDDWCCGFGGAFSVRFPEISTAMAERKMRDIESEGVDYLVSPEASCLLQLEGLARRRGWGGRALHVAEVLAGVCG